MSVWSFPRMINRLRQFNIRSKLVVYQQWILSRTWNAASRQWLGRGQSFSLKWARFLGIISGVVIFEDAWGIVCLSAMNLVNLNWVLQLLKHARSYNLPVLKSANFKTKKQRQGLKTTIRHKASFISMKNDVGVLPIDKNANCRFP